MLGAFLAILAGLGNSLGVVFSREGLKKSGFFSVSIIIGVVGTLAVWPLALVFTNFEALKLESILLFISGGIVAPGISRLLFFKGMEAIDVSINTSIFSTYPMFSSILAVLFLGEILAWTNWIGMTLIVAGVFSIERRLSKPRAETQLFPRRGIAFSLLAALAVGFSFIAKKAGLIINNEPLLAVAVCNSSSVLIYMLLLLSSPKLRAGFSFSEGFNHSWKAGVFMVSGVVCGFLALSIERISVVTPLIQTQPLFVLLFAYLLFKDLKPLSFRLVLSTVLIVVGVAFVSAS